MSAFSAADVTKLKVGIAKVLDESIKNAPYPVSYKLLLDQSRFMTDQVQSIGNNAGVGVVSMLIFLGLVMGFRSAFAQLFSTPVIVVMLRLSALSKKLAGFARYHAAIE